MKSRWEVMVEQVKPKALFNPIATEKLAERKPGKKVAEMKNSVLSVRFAVKLGSVGIMVMVAVLALAGIVQAAGPALVDWEGGLITSIAMADPMAQRGSTVGQKVIMARTAALSMAEAYLLGAVKGIKIDRDTTIDEAIVRGDLIKKKVQGVIRRAMVVEEGVNELDLYEVQVALRLDDLVEAILPEDAAVTDGGVPAPAAPVEKLPPFYRSHKLNKRYLGLPAEEPTGEIPAAGTGDAGEADTGETGAGSSGDGWWDDTGYTAGESAGSGLADAGLPGSVRPGAASSVFSGGPAAGEGTATAHMPVDGVRTADARAVLIIDCRGLDGVIRDRAPVIYSISGKTVLKGYEIPYCRSVDEAVKTFGDGLKPIIVKAVGVFGGVTSSPHVIVSDKDAGMILAANKKAKFIEGGMVVIVLGDKK